MRPAARRTPPRWLLAALPACLVVGTLIGVYAPSLPTALGPRRGPPDTLRVAGRVAVPRPPPVVEAPYLERVVERKTPREVAVSRFAGRYNITEALARTIHDAAVEAGIDPDLGFRLVRVESVFDADAVGQGAVGLCQAGAGSAGARREAVHRERAAGRARREVTARARTPSSGSVGCPPNV